MKIASCNWYLFRHALSTLSPDGYGDEILTKEILPDYVDPIKKIGKYLKKVSSSRNYSSPLIRCRQTAEIITQITGKIFNYDERISEYYQENFYDLKKRIQYFVEDINKITVKNVIVCTHGSVIAGIKNFIVSGDFQESNLYDYPECGGLLIIRGDNVESHNFTT